MEKDQEKPILISSENLRIYGFACFYPEQVPELVKGYWHREVEIAVGGVIGPQVKKFRIPESLLINLSGTSKIVDDRHFSITSHDSEIEIIKLLSERAGWNQTFADLQSMISHGKGGIFIAYYNYLNHEFPLGSGVSFPVHEDLAWIGMILVHKELRRQGIARRMMRICLAHSRMVQKKSIIGLDATPLGKQVYDSLGFKDSFLIWRSIIQTDNEKGEFAETADIPFNLEEVQDYLVEKNYPERFQIVKLLGELQGSKNMMAISKNRILGFIMSRPGRLKPFIGPLIADSPEIANYLLREILHHWKGEGYKEVFMDIPEQHLGEDSVFKNSEVSTDSSQEHMLIKPVRSLMRMYQLISDVEISEYSQNMDETALQMAVEGYEKTRIFMEKERNDIVPIMFGTSGPEWS